MAQPAKIAVTNQKGGVGKSTVAINVAGALNQRGRDVLFVDIDPQGNATEDLGMPDAYDEAPPSLFDCLTEPEDRERVTEIVREHEEMDVIPSNIDMTAAEPELTLSRRGGEQLDLLLEYVEDDYDYVIIDCPPNLGNLTDNALFAAQNILIPALAESTSKRAFELLFDHVGSLELDYEITIDEVGVVTNRIDVRKNQAQHMVEWINDAFDDVPVWEVRERADIQYALEDGVSLLEYNPESDMCEVFLEIAAGLDDQFGFAEPEVRT
ncbi:chromosome partitioning protein ParA [Natrinema sp. CBA1119]|uniref:ParA family protein n=1 Tax=Natrinema sp. CBA1119 TaxID=1608465 RepID=UPI000BF506EB|nr:ParA family protein [Natrinema sp. CBA1119]PGF14421.1 chromosome partitioning protein ParA [Natrinema sp. CBA1119]